MQNGADSVCQLQGVGREDGPFVDGQIDELLEGLHVAFVLLLEQAVD